MRGNVEIYRRIVVKIGTTIITRESGGVDRDRARDLAEQVAEARERGVDIVLVSSGAIAAGVEELGLGSRPQDVESLQAVAAVGQGLLLRMYTDMLGDCGLTTGQLLLTDNDMTHRQQYLNARRTLQRLFEMGVVPVINENDTVATDEITFGDNDTLAALVASLAGADLLLLLTDTEGLYTANPRENRKAALLKRVESITPEIEGLAGKPGSELSSGGMYSKVQAAKVAVTSGVPTIIADGRKTGILRDVLDGRTVGTYFPASGRVRSKKHWIGFARRSRGTLVLDRGAARAVADESRSLLPAGVVEVHGEFQVGDCVDILGPDRTLIGRGLTSYGSGEARRIKGLRTGEIAGVLGEEGCEMIHRDVLVVFEGGDRKE